MPGQPTNPSPQLCVLCIPPANKTPLLQHRVNIYSALTILELKAEGHTEVKVFERKSYLPGQCYNFLGVECGF